ncbi:MAG: cysteine hydrolase [Eubacterium sp.]|nr:cysteine hydrolase [Eubacterium sp.]
MQNDYLWELRRPKFNYDTEQLVSAVNEAIASYREQGYDIIYVAHILPDLPTNRKLIGFSIQGTAGAELYGKLDIVSGLYFEKHFSDTYTSKDFRQHMEQQKYSEVVLCGLDECGCVGATAKGAVKTGARVYMPENCIGRRFPEKKVQKMRNDLKALGVVYI